MSEKLSHLITQKDISDKAEMESRIDRNIQNVEHAVDEIGRDLREIRDRKIYLIDADNFEDYVRARFAKSRSWIYQQISFADVRDSLSSEMSTVVDTENKARPLAPVPEAKREVVVKRAMRRTNGHVTAKALTEVAREVISPPVPPKPAPKPAQPTILLDKTGFPVPKIREAMFEREEEVKILLKSIAHVRGALRRVMENSDPMFRHVGVTTVMADLDRSYSEIKMAIPYAVCPYCQGQTSDHCQPCLKTGFLPQFKWEHAVPEKLRNVRGKSCNK